MAREQRRNAEGKLIEMQLIERVPPHSIEAEQAVLASLLVDREVVDNLVQGLLPQAFYRDAHGTILQAVRRLHEKGSPVDLITVRDALTEANALEEVGGYGYLIDLASSIPTTAHAEHYARMVQGGHALRSFIRLLSDAIAEAYETPLDDAAIVVNQLMTRLGAIEGQASGHVFHIEDLLNDWWEDLERRQETQGVVRGLVATPFYDLNYLLSGFHPTDLILLAARPSMGKTALSLNFARHAALEERLCVLFVSLEMSKEQLLNRLVADVADVDSRRIGGREKLSEEEWARVAAAKHRLQESKLSIVVPGGRFGVSDLAREINQMRVRGRKPDLVIVDYLQLMSESVGKGDNRNLEVGAISKGLKGVARDQQIPVIALSQLSRDVEKRPDKRPMLSDLRDSGSLEQDADVVSFVYRDDYYNPKTEKQGVAEVIIAKHRNGPIGKVELRFDKAKTRFSDYIPTYSMEGGFPDVR